MKFTIDVKIDGRPRRYVVECIYKDDRIERYRINGRDRFIILETNRPVFINRGLKHRRAKWTLYEGTVKSPRAFEEIYKAVEAYLSLP